MHPFQRISVFSTEEGPRSFDRSTESVLDITVRGEMLLFFLGEALLNIICEISVQHNSMHENICYEKYS